MTERIERALADLRAWRQKQQAQERFPFGAAFHYPENDLGQHDKSRLMAALGRQLSVAINIPAAERARGTQP